ncbi:peptide ABC transporter substrate-binding protein [Virgibacillus byunsanensis]|uniref:Peptide ABC transporter substrate-binding protein n=1 Tax=Virgibacillus byunsanensis TaxID=570945 RepID=A0ABW3LJZ5_9BACI
MNRKKWSLLLTLVFAMSIFLAACGGDENSEESGEDGDSTSEQVLNVNIKSEPPALNPGQATDTTSAAVLDQIFEGLTRVNQNGEVEKAMAEDYEISEDQKTYTFTIREDATWSNGDPVTAQDFEYAWKWILDPESPDTDFAYYLNPIKNAEQAKLGEVSLDEVGVTAEDDQTLVVELEQPTPYFLELTAFFSFYPVNHNVVENAEDWAQDKTENYVTNGPFTMESWKHKDQIVLKKNPDYWDAETVQLETINMYMIDDENTELQMYENGELDWAGSPTGDLPLSAISSLKEEGSLNISSLAGVYYYIFNTEEEPFTNKNIRKAFALSINREGIIQNITKAEQQPATALVPSSIFEENKEGYFKDNDVESAKEYLQKGLEEEGLDELPTIKLSYNTSEAHASIAQAIQDMWKENLDVDVELHNEEWNVYLDSMSEGNFQMGRMGWLGTINDASNFLDIFETADGNNYSRWEDEEYANLLEEARTETDEAERRKILRDAEQVFMDAMPIAPIYFYTNVWVNKDYVKDISVSSLGGIQYKWGYIEGK